MKGMYDMNIITAETVYQTLTDSLIEDYRIPEVENAFAVNSPCAKLYAEIYRANHRLCARLGQTNADPDVELIIDNLLEINRILCLKMYDYGQKYHY